MGFRTKSFYEILHRCLLGITAGMKTRLAKLFKNKHTRYAVLIFAFSVLLATAVMLWFKNNAQVAEVITYSTNQPSEEKPDESFKWKGGPEDPKKITIKSIGVDAYIQNVGVDQNNEVAVPNNIHIAGWFNQSARPGESGYSVIDGHIDGVTQRTGVFAKLPDVSEGAEIVIEFGNGTQKVFRVFEVTELSANDAPARLFSISPDKNQRQLNLITCVGNYDKKTKRYDKRYIVASELVE